MSNIATKLQTIAENQQKVYDKGYAEGQRALVNKDTIIEKTVSGDLIYLNDVSEIPHNITVQLSSDTIADFSGVSVEVLGKNLVDADNFILGKEIQGAVGGKISLRNDSLYAYMPNIKVLPGTQYTISLDNSVYWLSRICEMDSNDVMVYNHSHYTSTSKDYPEYTFVTQSKTSYIIFHLENKNNKNATLDDLKNINLQVERSSIKTDYEAYKLNTYIVNENGTINLTSNYPHMIFNTNNSEVSMSITYQQSYGVYTEWNRFWDNLQLKGNKTKYENAFYASSWTEDIFKPKYNIISTDLYGTFYATQIGDLKKILEKQNVYLDTSNCTNFTNTFRESTITHIPVIDASNAKALTNTFYNMQNLVTIDKLIVSENITSYSATFHYTPFLENLMIEGAIAAAFSVQHLTVLSKDSIISIINALSSTTSGLTVTFSLKAVKTAFNTTDPATCEEWLALKGTKSNWTFSLV